MVKSGLSNPKFRSFSKGRKASEENVSAGWREHTPLGDRGRQDLNSRPAWSTQRVWPGQPGLYREILSLKRERKKKRKEGRKEGETVSRNKQKRKKKENIQAEQTPQKKIKTKNKQKPTLFPSLCMAFLKQWHTLR